MSVRIVKRSNFNKQAESTTKNETKENEKVSETVSGNEASPTRRIARRQVERKVTEVGEKKTLKVEKKDDVSEVQLNH